ncbi:MAG: pyrroline-5-carboxylate reductase family protein, partial [Alphaproteobacteria bacterium]
QMDAVTGLSGSGPAFVAYLIESFIAAGREAGLAENVARTLALKTFEGTAGLLSTHNMQPRELIAMVSSPNGTTVAGREVLEASDVAEVIKRTVSRAAERSVELGK